MSRQSAEIDATIDVCSESGSHEPHLRLSIPWRDSILVQHNLWCLGAYDQRRQGNHVTIETDDFEHGSVVSERPCEFGCQDPAHPRRRRVIPPGEGKNSE